jgi:5-formyltetrahydrofolate cyclo-ligase
VGRDEKQAIRERIWRRMREARVHAFPGPEGRIPNFAGSGEAAERLAATDEWEQARTVKCNPDAAQRPVRSRALAHGKIVYVAVPRLREARCFLELDPAKIGERARRRAVTIGGAAELGRPVHPREMPRIDLLVCGCVAVDRRGRRLGKGGGYSDLEFALGQEYGTIDDDTVTATTVHPLQIVDGPLPCEPHDFPLDLIVTPDEVLRPRRRKRPPGIVPGDLAAEVVAAVPALRELGFR